MTTSSGCEAVQVERESAIPVNHDLLNGLVILENCVVTTGASRGASLRADWLGGNGFFHPPNTSHSSSFRLHNVSDTPVSYDTVASTVTDTHEVSAGSPVLEPAAQGVSVL
jgi:hypothetical protein